MLPNQHPNHKEIKMLLTFCEKKHQKEFADILRTFDIEVLKVAIGLLQSEKYPVYIHYNPHTRHYIRIFKRKFR